jgi:hypothetical protein
VVSPSGSGPHDSLDSLDCRVGARTTQTVARRCRRSSHIVNAMAPMPNRGQVGNLGVAAARPKSISVNWNGGTPLLKLTRSVSIGGRLFWGAMEFKPLVVSIAMTYSVTPPRIPVAMISISPGVPKRPNENPRL